MDSNWRARERTAEGPPTGDEAPLRDLIESISEGFAVFDVEDRLVSCNEIDRSLFLDAADYIVPGVRYEDILRKGLARGHYADAVGREEEWLAERLGEHRNPTGASEHRLSDGRCVLVTKRRMATCPVSSQYLKFIMPAMGR